MLEQLKHTGLTRALRGPGDGDWARVAGREGHRRRCEGSLPLLEVMDVQNRCLTGFTISNSFKLPLQWLFVFCLPHLYLFETDSSIKLDDECLLGQFRQDLLQLVDQ